MTLLTRESGSASDARTLVRAACRRAHIAATVTDTAALLTSELVTNAFLHGEGETLFRLDIWHDHLRVSVTDGASGVPEVKQDNPVLAAHGRGLLLVEALASRWGVARHRPSEKSVWFEIDNG